MWVLTVPLLRTGRLVARKANLPDLCLVVNSVYACQGLRQGTTARKGRSLSRAPLQAEWRCFGPHPGFL